MKTEFKNSKHTRLVCDLYVGQQVEVDNWGYELNGKTCTITDIKLGHGQTGVLVKIDLYPNYIDSDWIKLTPAKDGMKEGG